MSGGFFQALVSENVPTGSQPTLQIIETRTIPHLNMLRLRLSDGLFTYANCNANLELAKKLEAEGYTEKHGIIKVTKFTRTVLGGKPWLTITNYECMKITSTIIGEPMPHSGNPDEYRGIENFVGVLQSSQKSQSQHSQQFASRKRALEAENSGVPIKRKNMPDLVQISTLSPDGSTFRICGAVSMKENPRTINTKRGQSTVFSFVLTDTDGHSIKITSFGKECERFTDFVKNGEAYYVLCSGDHILREANKRFNSTGHAYEITLNAQCDIDRCDDRDIGTPTVKLNNVPLVDIKNHENECVDVLAIIDKVGEIASVTTKTTQQQLQRRNVTLIDTSCTKVLITLWRDDVKKITPEQIGQVIGIKGASVREFKGGFSLSLGSGSSITTAPNGQDAKDLCDWYSGERSDIPIANLKSDTGIPPDQGCRVIHCLNKVNLDKLSRGIFASVQAFVSVIKSENVAYMACPIDNCKKKVTEEDNKWRCSNCGIFGTYKFLYLLNIEIGDFSGLTWITMFDETASAFFGMSAEKLMDLQGRDPIACEEVLEKNLYQTLEFRVRITSEIYEGQKRNRWSCTAVRPVNVESYKSMLKNELVHAP